jgi:hypothetical protein
MPEATPSSAVSRDKVTISESIIENLRSIEASLAETSQRASNAVYKLGGSYEEPQPEKSQGMENHEENVFNTMKDWIGEIRRNANTISRAVARLEELV